MSPQNFASKASGPRFTTLDKAHVRTHASAKIDFVNPTPQILGLIQEKELVSETQTTIGDFWLKPDPK